MNNQACIVFIHRKKRRNTNLVMWTNQGFFRTKGHWSIICYI